MISETTREKLRTKAKLRGNNGNTRRGPHSAETRAKLSAALKGRHIGAAQPGVNLGRKYPGTKRGPRSEEYKQKQSVAIKKAYENPAYRAKTSEATKRHMAQCDGSCGSVSCGARPNPSGLAWKFWSLFLQDFEVVIPEARFGPYSVDFLLAEEWLAIEVDGDYWHRNVDHTKRDEYLLREHGLPVARVTEKEITQSRVE